MIKNGEITNNIKLTERHHRLCYASLSNLSLVDTTHIKNRNPECRIWTNENLTLLFKNIREMKVLLQQGNKPEET